MVYWSANIFSNPNQSTLKFLIRLIHLGFLITLNQTIRWRLLDPKVSPFRACTCGRITNPLGTFYFWQYWTRLCVFYVIWYVKIHIWLTSFFIYALTCFIVLIHVCWIWMNVFMYHLSICDILLWNTHTWKLQVR